jgi:DNA-binding SARP family transcriptional activator/ATP/maltotriose-dependent transcriptional regulator MalT
VVALIAPSGWGKTVACAWAARRSGRCAWLTVQTAHEDALHLAASLAQELGEVNPRAGREVLAAARGAGPDAVGRALASEAAALAGAGPFLLVLDDLTALEGGRSGAKAVAASILAWQAGTLILAADTAAEWLTDALAEVPATVLGPRELTLTPGETATLAAISPGLADEIQVRSEGRPAIVAAWTRSGDEGRADPEPLPWSSADQLELALSRVLSRLDETERRQLEEVSVLDPVRLEDARAVLADRHFGGVLDRLATRGLLVLRHGSDRFRIHALLRARLLADLGSERPHRARELRTRCAELALDRGDAPECVGQLMEAGAWRQALDVLGNAGDELVRGGRAEHLWRLLAAFPPEARATPVFAWVRGYLLAHQGDLAGARALAEEGLALSPPPALAGRLLMVKAQAAHLAGRFEEELTSLEQALEHLGPTDRRWRAELLVLLGVCLARLGSVDDAEARLREALAAAELAGDVRIAEFARAHAGFADLRRGNLGAAAAAFGAAVQSAERSGDRRRLAFAWNNLGWVQYLSGRWDAAAAAFEAAQAHAETTANRFVLIASQRNLGEVLLVKGFVDAAEERFRAALEAFAGIRSDVGRRWALLGLGQVALCRGDAEVAQRLFDEARRAAGASGERDEELRIATMLAFSAGLAGAPGAEGELERLINDLDRAGHRVYRALAEIHLWSFRAWAGTVDRARAQRGARAAGLAVGSPALATLPWLWPEERGAAPSPTLSLRLLGRLDLRRSGRRLPGGRWRRPGAALILAFLALHRGALVTQDRLVEEFWPDRDPQKARGSLHTAVWYLRKLLGEGVIVSAGEGYVLEAAGLSLDVASFEDALARAAAQPSSRLDALREALAAYRDHFLAGSDLPPSLELERQSLATRHRAASLEAARFLAREGRHAEALEVLRAARALHPLEEDVVRELMSLLAEAGNPEAALAEFESLRAGLRRAAEIPPLPETEAVAEAIRRGRPAPADLN